MSRNLFLTGLVRAACLSCAMIAPAGPTLAQASEGTQAPGRIDEARAVAADDDIDNWLLHGRTYEEKRYSPLADINRENVDELGLAWSFKIDDDRGMEATPIVVDGVMYVTGPWSKVYALDATSGELLWKYDPEVDRQVAQSACCDVVNRGVAVWKGRVYVGVIDGRLAALDAGTGEVDWIVDTVIDASRNYTITGAPRIVKDKVLIGNGGAEYGVRGYVTAYDSETGEEAWRFFTVPGDPDLPPENDAMAMARETWFGTDYAEYGGGGTVWDSMSYDPELNLLYIGVGNSSVWSRKLRSEGKGDNLFVSSIVALNPDTGEYVWHYQTTPGDEWDFTATQQMTLADIEIDGELRKVIMQAPKNGFFYVIDRTDGTLISAENYVPVNWAEGIDIETGRPIFNEEIARYDDGELKLVTPSGFGGHNWHPMSFNPETGLMYIPAMIGAWYFQAIDESPMPTEKGTYNFGAIITMGMPPEEGSEVRPSAEDIPDLSKAEDRERMQEAWHGRLIAWDPVAQKARWSKDYTAMYNGGTLTTAGGLVFQGTGAGEFFAYDAEDGKVLYETPVNTGIVAAPVTYRVDGEQYVAVSVGWGGGYTLFSGPVAQQAKQQANAQVMVFKLGGKAEMPLAKAPLSEPSVLPQAEMSDERLAHGALNFLIHCAACHGVDAISGGVVPDLRYMSEDTFEVFDVIMQGGLASAGMPDFSKKLSADEQQELKQYIARRNEALRAELAQ